MSRGGRIANLCRAGHLVEGANVYHRKDGYAMCRECLKDRAVEARRREQSQSNRMRVKGPR